MSQKLTACLQNVAAPLEFCIKADAEEEDLKGSVGVTLRFKWGPRYLFEAYTDRYADLQADAELS